MSRCNQPLFGLQESSRYEERRAAVEEFNKAHMWRKRGLSIMPTRYVPGTWPVLQTRHLFAACVSTDVNPRVIICSSFSTRFVPFMFSHAAGVSVFMDGSVLVHHSGVEMGQGISTKVKQVC